VYYEQCKESARTLYTLLQSTGETRGRQLRLFLSMALLFILTGYGTFYSVYMPSMYINDGWTRLLLVQMLLCLAQFTAIVYLMTVFARIGWEIAEATIVDESYTNNSAATSKSCLVGAVALGCLLFKLGFNVFIEFMGMVCGTNSSRSLYFISADVTMFVLLLFWDKPLREQLTSGAERGPHRCVAGVTGLVLLTAAIWVPQRTC